DSTSGSASVPPSPRHDWHQWSRRSPVPGRHLTAVLLLTHARGVSVLRAHPTDPVVPPSLSVAPTSAPHRYALSSEQLPTSTPHLRQPRRQISRSPPNRCTPMQRGIRILPGPAAPCRPRSVLLPGP